MDRKKTPQDTETAVLIKSGRRCALCFGLSHDLSEKRGQIAHLDQDPSNYAEDNLAYLCIDHHSLYDSRTSQHKNYTIHEVKAMRQSLHDAIREGQHRPQHTSPLVAAPVVDLDERRFFEQRRALPETPFIKRAWQVPHWRIIIRPTKYMEAQFRELDDCSHFMRTRHIECPGNVPYPCIHRHFKLLVDEELQVVCYELDAEGQPVDTLYESWALFRTGQFVHTRPLPQFKQIPDSIHFLEILRVVSHVFEFAKRMAAYDAMTPEAYISISLRNIPGLKLYVPDNDGTSFCKVPRIEFPGQFTTTALAEESATLALETALQFYRAFGWADADITALSSQQRRFLIGC